MMTSSNESEIPHGTTEGFRRAMRALASGVCVVASRTADGQARGIAMTAVMSLSFDPPTLLLAINRSASLIEPLIEKGTFSVNILGEDDGDWCQTFTSAPFDERFKEDDWLDHASGVPLYRRAIATVICDVDAADPFGTHMIVRGLVRDCELGDHTRALIYLDGSYARAAG